MSLNFDLRDVPEDVWKIDVGDGTKTQSPTTTTIIFATMAVGIGEITEDNYIEFWMRHVAVDAISPWPGDPTKITLEDVKRHIGLRTNVSKETRNQWAKRMFDGSLREYQYRARRDAKEAA